jgi:hypothetical protein
MLTVHDYEGAGAIAWGGERSVTPSLHQRRSGDARATTWQQTKTTGTSLSGTRGTRDATEGPRSFGLCCPRSSVSEEFYTNG